MLQFTTFHNVSINVKCPRKLVMHPVPTLRHNPILWFLSGYLADTPITTKADAILKDN